MSKEESVALWDWYEKGGLDAIIAMLYARDVSAFNPGAAPPMTDAKACMIEQGHSSGESFLIDMVREERGPFADGVVSGPWHSIIDRVQGEAPQRIQIYQAALFHALREAGWVDCGMVHSTDYKTKKHIYASPTAYERHSKSELRRMIEPKPAAAKVANSR